MESLQHFNSGEWANVCYASALKEYLADPGFKELEVNCEVLAFDTASPIFPAMEKMLAAVTHASLKQRECLQQALQKTYQMGK